MRTPCDSEIPLQTILNVCELRGLAKLPLMILVMLFTMSQMLAYPLAPENS